MDSDSYYQNLINGQLDVYRDILNRFTVKYLKELLVFAEQPSNGLKRVLKQSCLAYLETGETTFLDKIIELETLRTGRVTRLNFSEC